MIKVMLSREKIAHLPTPVERLPRLSKKLEGPELLIKRDDQTGLAFGGNKTRKLEYLLADARVMNANRVLTTGAAQSNHCRQTAAAAARMGLKCTLVLVGPQPDQPSANFFLDRLLGAEIVWTNQEDRDQVLEREFQAAAKAGDQPYLIPYGGSNAIGAYAYYQAYQELQDQLVEAMPDWIVLASSSGGTQAGLAFASQQLGGSRVLGISVDESQDALQKSVAKVAGMLAEKLGEKGTIEPQEVLVNADYTGEGYGIMTDLDREAIRLFARTEGVLLDPVYTGRAGAGLVDLIRRGFFKADQRVLFWHTGGTPSLFADKYVSDI
jgi:D-cysteine desulfhydrase family pyridoxal phosphate-dependent enzyme